MSYNRRDEIASELENEIVDVLGGMIVTIDEDGYKCFEAPFDAYDKGCDEIISFRNVEDFDKVMNHINDDSQEKFRLNNKRLIVANRNRTEMRFKLN